MSALHDVANVHDQLLANARALQPVLRERIAQVRLRAGDVLLLQGEESELPDAVAAMGCLPLATRNLNIGRGGKGLIARMENGEAENAIDSAWFGYGLTLAHKHVPEMQEYSALEHPPLFSPSVGRFRQGMVVQVPLQLWSLPSLPTGSEIRDILQAWYEGCEFVPVADAAH